jgi:tetratricopeptide (TPR) repeat protein
MPVNPNNIFENRSTPKRHSTQVTAAGQSPASTFSKHFQNQVATSTYVPFSDQGTLTEEDLGKASEPEDATCMIDVHEMQRKIMQDKKLLEGAAPDPLEDLKLDIEESTFYMEQGLYEEARATLNELHEQYPGHPLVAEKLRVLEEKSPRSAPMERLPIPALEDRPALVSAGEQGLSTHFELGLAYREMGLHQDSISEFQNSIEEGSQIGESHFLIGQSFIDQGELKQAIEPFEQALESQTPTDDLINHILYRLGLVHEFIGEGQVASSYYKRISSQGDLFPDIGQRISYLGR